MGGKKSKPKQENHDRNREEEDLIHSHPPHSPNANTNPTQSIGRSPSSTNSHKSDSKGGGRSSTHSGGSAPPPYDGAGPGPGASQPTMMEEAMYRDATMQGNVTVVPTPMPMMPMYPYGGYGMGMGYGGYGGYGMGMGCHRGGFGLFF